MRNLFILAMAAACVALGACNTIAGVGEDLSAAGRAVSDTADSTR